MAGSPLSPLPGPAEAQTHPQDHYQAGDAVRAREVQPLSSILPGIQRRYPGEFIDAAFKPGNGNRPPVYRIKMLERGGKVRIVVVDARNGRVLRD